MSAPDFDGARLELARLHAAPGVRLRQVWLQLAELVASTLRIERIGVWVLIDEDRAIRCRYLLQRSSHQIFQGAVLRAQDFPSYFRALESSRTIAADEAPAAPATRELREAYLDPLGISSMLDAPLYVDGRLVGVVCHEHVGPMREWTDAEKDFAGAVADNVARLYVEHERHNAEATLQAYERHLMEMHRLEAVGRMAAGVAHDFRGIVGAALGFTELLRRVPHLPEQADQHAQRIVEALERGRQLTQQIMNVGKDDAVSPSVLDAGAVIDSMSNMFRMMLGDGVRFTTSKGSAVSRIFMDASQLERAMLNLVLNARDAMPAGGDLSVKIEDESQENEHGEDATFVSISVADTGVGMDEQTRLNAFKPFFTTKGDGGTGLGLVIVDQIVTRAGGHIRIDSEPGHGTRVALYLPRIAAATR